VIGDSFARDFINMGIESHQLDRHAISLVYSSGCMTRRRLPALAAQAPRADFIVIARQLRRTDSVACPTSSRSCVR
jgi:hypothetical protein